MRGRTIRQVPTAGKSRDLLVSVGFCGALQMTRDVPAEGKSQGSNSVQQCAFHDRQIMLRTDPNPSYSSSSSSSSGSSIGPHM